MGRRPASSSLPPGGQSRWRKLQLLQARAPEDAGPVLVVQEDTRSVEHGFLVLLQVYQQSCLARYSNIVLQSQTTD